MLKNYSALFLASAVSSALALMVSLTFKEGARVRVAVALLPLIKSNRKVYLSLFARQMGAQAVWAIFPLYLSSIGASKMWIALMDGINMGSQFILMLLVERFNPAQAFRAGLLLSATVLAIYGLASSYLQLLPVQVVLGGAWACLFVGSLGYLLRKNAERGSAAGLIYSTIYLSAGVGPFVGGAVSELWGFGPLMFISSAVTLVGFLYSRGLNIRK